MSEWRRYYGQDWPPVPDGAGGYRPITREFAAMLIAKKWKFFKEEQGIEFKDPWEPLIDAAKALIPEQYFKVPPWTEEHFHDWVMAPSFPGKGVITWGCGSCGKALLPTEPVYTETGVKAIGELKPGDMIYAATGALVRVRGVYRQLDMPLFRVKFDDGTETICAKDHLWTVQYWGRIRWEGPRKTRKGVDGYKTVTIPVDRMASWSKKNLRQRRVSIPVTAPLEFPVRDVPLDPYVLGVLLGDGSLSGTVLLSSHESDVEIRDEVNRRLSVCCPGYGLVRVGHSTTSYMVVNLEGRRFRNPVITALRELGLYGKVSNNKSVPECYKWNSVENRIDLLAGLFDTDGTVSRSGHASFTTVSPQLARDVQFMLGSLGIPATINEHKTTCQLAYTVYLRATDQTMIRRLFKLRRKADRVAPVTRNVGRRSIWDVSPVENREDYPRETVCITIDGEDVAGRSTGGLFPVGNFIVTHNSNDYGLLMLLDWITDPYDTVIRLGSTDKQSLKSRSWNAVVTYFAALRKNKLGLVVPGKFSKSGYAILNDGDADSPESIGEKTGIVGVAINDSEDSGKLQGAHAKFVRIVVDELATITHHDNIRVAIQNLRVGAIDFRFYALANPASWEDPSCQYCIPVDGIDSVNVDTGTWTSTRGYFIRHHDGLKCITVTDPGKSAEYPFLITKEVADANLADCDGNEDAPIFWRMVRGFPVPRGTAMPTVLDSAIARDQRVTDPCSGGPVVAVAAGIDPAWTEGGDGAVYQRVLVRTLADGRPVLDFGNGQHRLKIGATSEKTVTEQLLDQVETLIRDPGSWCAPLEATAVDASGNQTLADDLDIFFGGAAARCMHVNNSAKASQNPLRATGVGMADTAKDKKPERCCDRFRDRGTEAWCILAEFCKAGMVRGLPPDALEGLVKRRFSCRKNTSVQQFPLVLEPKDDFKKRLRRSPDETDACALAALAVKEVLGVLPYCWLMPAQRPAVAPQMETQAQAAPMQRFAAPAAGAYSSDGAGCDSYDPREATT